MAGPYRKTLIAMSVCSALTLTACGGGGGSDDTSTNTTNNSSDPVIGLKMPSKMNLVGSQSATGARYAGRGIAEEELNLDLAERMVESSVVSGFSSNSDYIADAEEAETWVWDPSMESLNIVNEILCYVQQTGAKDMVNVSDGYIAMINEDKCQEGQNQSSASSGGAQSSSASANTIEYENWTVVSTRTDNDSAQLVKIWVPGEADAENDPMDAQRILVETTITEGVTAEKPFGSFVLNFKGEAPIGPNGSYETIMQGTLKTVDNTDGKPQFEYFSSSDADTGDSTFSRVEKSNVVMDDADGTTGQAKTFMSESYADTSNTFSKQNGFNVAYNNSHFLRGKDTDGDNTVDQQVCTARDNFSTQTWRYNIYHTSDETYNGQQVSAGQRVSLNSGFPFYYDDSEGRHFGHVGYWGIWTEEELSLAELTDQTVTQQNFGDNASTETFNVQVSAGKLWRRSKIASTYADMVGTAFNWWGDASDPDCESDNGCMHQQDYRATVVDQGGGNFKLMVTHSLTWGGQGGPTLTDITDVDITPTNEWNQRWMWADTLGGSVVFKPANATESVVFFKEEQVSPGEANLPTQLYCYERCLKGGLTASTVLNDETGLFHIMSNDGTQQHRYTLSSNNGQFVLRDENDNPVEIGFDISDIADWYEWGINTGEMSTAQISPSEWWSLLDNANVTYRWETGTNAWNRTVSVVDVNGISQTFDKPLHFQYTYFAGDDPNGDNFANGTPFMLEYGGPGELWGFPSEKMDDTCDESSEDCRWVSGLTLKTGVELIDDDSNSYIVRAMESEQSMIATSDTTPCTNTGLNVDNISLTLPSAIDGTVGITWNDKPVVTDPPAVIEGEIQTQ